MSQDALRVVEKTKNENGRKLHQSKKKLNGEIPKEPRETRKTI